MCKSICKKFIYTDLNFPISENFSVFQGVLNRTTRIKVAINVSSYSEAKLGFMVCRLHAGSSVVWHTVKNWGLVTKPLVFYFMQQNSLRVD